MSKCAQESVRSTEDRCKQDTRCRNRHLIPQRGEIAGTFGAAWLPAGTRCEGAGDAAGHRCCSQPTISSEATLSLPVTGSVTPGPEG